MNQFPDGICFLNQQDPSFEPQPSLLIEQDKFLDAVSIYGIGSSSLLLVEFNNKTLSLLDLDNMQQINLILYDVTLFSDGLVVSPNFQSIATYINNPKQRFV